MHQFNDILEFVENKTTIFYNKRNYNYSIAYLHLLRRGY